MIPTVFCRSAGVSPTFTARRSIAGLQWRRPVNGAASRLILLCLLLLAGCQPSAPSFALDTAFPNADTISGWKPNDDPIFYDSETIYDLVNGQAEAFFAYNFEQVAVQSYSGEDNIVRVEIWQLATPADAYGLFTRGRTGQPADVGNKGDTDPGRRIVFWQDRFYAQVSGQKQISDDTLRAFADAIASVLPIGGEVPELVEQLPQDNLVARSAVFFRQELSIQDEIWLGGENVLGLNAETEGVLARYDLDAGSNVYLLVVQYPDAEVASAALAALASSDTVDLALADVNGTRFGAVFGQVEPETVRQLLDAALK